MKLFHRHYGKGYPVIILHGVFGISDNWVSVGRKLAESFSVYIPDQRNHGLSPHSELFTYQAMSNDVLEFMDQQNLTEAIIIGHSMGGKTAMQFAFDNLDKLSKLIVVDITPRHYEPHENVIEGLKSIDVKAVRSRKEAHAQLSNYIHELD